MSDTSIKNRMNAIAVVRQHVTVDAGMMSQLCQLIHQRNEIIKHSVHSSLSEEDVINYVEHINDTIKKLLIL